jgi:hypothetical protein
VYHSIAFLPITKFGSIPKRRSLMVEMTPAGRKAGYSFLIALKAGDPRVLAKQLLTENFELAPPAMDTLLFTIRPFGSKDSASYSFPFTNWFNNKIRSLQEQLTGIDTTITELHTNPDLKISFDILPDNYRKYGTQKPTQLQFSCHVYF